MPAGLNKKMLLLVSWYNVVREIGCKIHAQEVRGSLTAIDSPLEKVDLGKKDPSSDILICKSDQNPTISGCFVKCFYI